MTVDVTEVRPGGEVLLSALGTILVGVWRGDVEAAVGRWFAELELAAIRWSDVHVLTGSSEHGPIPAGTVRAEVIDYDYDGVATLRCEGVDVMVEIDGEPVLGVVGSNIEFAAPKVEVYPYDM